MFSTSETDFVAFDTWVQQVLRPRVLDKNIRPSAFNRAMAHVQFLPEVMERQEHQKEVTLPIWEYLDITASDERARGGRQALRKHRDLFNRLELAFGVEPEILTAIWGLETGYGAVRGNVPVFSALTTLAYSGRRAAFFEDELVAALRMVQTGACFPAEMVGSWAGALGHGQFMPSSVLEFAVDFDGDGRADLCAEAPDDALASIAHYLKKHGWKKGQPWGFEVRLPKDFDYALTGVEQPRSIEDWCRLGVQAADGEPVPDYGPAAILLPAGANGVALAVLRNFYVIQSYNKSEAYAIAIGHLTDRIAGGKPFEGTWPFGEEVVSRTDVREIQFLLTEAGFDTQGIDGFVGPNTTRALRAWQTVCRKPADGFISADLLGQLRNQRA